MNDNAKKWVAALRSGNYRQGMGQLCSDDGYCCLGVACDVAVKSGLPIKVETSADQTTSYDGSSCLLPLSVMGWLGLKGRTGYIGMPFSGTRSLVDRNDSDGWSFSQIADLIESEPPGLFA